MKTKRATVLVNPRSGRQRAQKVLAAASRLGALSGWKVTARLLKSPADLEAGVRLSIRRGEQAVVIAGGDGSINLAAGLLAGKKTALGVIPLGTGNGFARGLGIPLDLEKAFDTIAAARIRRVDLGVANGRPFANIFGAGLDAASAAQSEKWRGLARVSSFLRYFLASQAVFWTFRAPRVRASNGRQAIEGRCLVAAVANSREYGLGTSVCPWAVPDDGVLELVLLQKRNYLFMVPDMARFFLRRPMRNIQTLRGSQFHIEQLEGEPLPYHLDGEPLGTLLARIRLRRRALKVIVP